MRGFKTLGWVGAFLLGISATLAMAGGIPKPGQPAPGFNLQSAQGDWVSLAGLKGKTVILYFYPKDGTPGCTKEACSFRDHYAALQSKGVVLLGVSVDPLASHQAFRDEHALPFPLLSDVSRKTVKKYGVWKWNKDRKAYGTVRSTFLIGPDGKIQRVWSPVTVEGHTDEILKGL